MTNTSNPEIPIKTTKHLFWRHDATGNIFSDGRLEVEFDFGLKVTIPNPTQLDRNKFDRAILNLADIVQGAADDA